MKKTVIALVCALVSSGALAGSISHGTSTTTIHGGGDYVYKGSAQATTTHGAFTVQDQHDDGSFDTVTTQAHQTYKTVFTDESGKLKSNGTATSTWTSNGQMTWGTSDNNITSSQRITGCGGASNDCAGRSKESTITGSDWYRVTTTTADGAVSEELNKNISGSRKEWRTGTVSTQVVSDGIFLE